MPSLIQNQRELRAELRRLQSRCKQIENQIDENIDNLKDNYKQMAFNSIVGNRLKNMPWLATVAGVVLGSPKMQDMMSTLLEKFLGKSAGFFDKWIAKLFPGGKD